MITSRYTAELDHTGKKLILRVLQTDAEGNEVEDSTEVFLSVRATPLPPESQSMGAGIIAAIVAVACFILLGNSEKLIGSPRFFFVF